MKNKKLLISTISLITLISIFLSVYLVHYYNSKTLNNIEVGMKLYTLSNYQKFDRDSLEKYFVDSMIGEILSKYIHSDYNDALSWETTTPPEVDILSVKKIGEIEYEAKIKFGQTIYIYLVKSKNIKITVVNILYSNDM